LKNDDENRLELRLSSQDLPSSSSPPLTNRIYYTTAMNRGQRKKVIERSPPLSGYTKGESALFLRVKENEFLLVDLRTFMKKVVVEQTVSNLNQ